ncbi:MAG TPA: 1-acyl-sn-glycerol-3-phosphate acyltransferase [Candidatus Paceibacterota bacterium]|nr:1-acyl-sn-glycerol-3-phosphate acyltransferase [Candidatus Paceibacterota bacterium]
MLKNEDYLSGFKMFLMALIPMSVIALLVIALPYAFSHSTLYVTPAIFLAIISFLMFLRSKYFWLFRDYKKFDQISTVFIWIIFISVIPILGSVALLIVLVNRKSLYSLIWVLSVIIVFIFGIKIKINGKLPTTQFILIWNHCSDVDDVMNPIIMGRRPWKVIFAKEIKRIPFVGNFLNYIGIPINRGEMRSKANVAKQVTNFLEKEKGNILVFPEGRRLLVEKKEELLMSFQNGAFHWSMEYDIPIVPVVVSWTFLFKPRSGQWWFSPRTIVINYLEPTKIQEGESVEDFSCRVRSLMLEKLKAGLKERRKYWLI